MGIITVTGTYGSAGTLFAQELSRRLNYRYVDRSLIDNVCQVEKDHVCVFGLEDEESPTFLDKLGELMSNRSFHKLALSANIYDYALRNNVVFTGMGAHLVLTGMTNVINILVVRPLSERVRAVALDKNISYDDALKVVEKEDARKKDFVAQYFDKDYLNPLFYHLIINSGWVTLEQAVDMVCRYSDQYFTLNHSTETEMALRNKLLEKRAEILLFRLGMVHDFGRVLFEVKEEGVLVVKGVIGGEKEKAKLLQTLRTLETVGKIEDRLKVSVLSRNIF
jgi:cytidylate kinase